MLNLDNAKLREIALSQTRDPVCLIGIRAVYEKTVKRGKFDDLIFLITPYKVLRFNANCDPSYFKPGIASLDCGTYKYKIGIHGLSKPKILQYEALVQATTVNITRDGGKKERGYFGINIHRGGMFGSTSSLGCQTIERSQWDLFIASVKEEMRKANIKEIFYVLKEGVV
jgi:hypothetical protein